MIIPECKEIAPMAVTDRFLLELLTGKSDRNSIINRANGSNDNDVSNF